MRTLFSTVLSLVILAPTLTAQNLPESGSAGLIFQIAGLGQFGVTGPTVGTTTLTPLGLEPIEDLLADLGLNIPVYGIGAKFFLSDVFAFRAALGLNYTAKTTSTPTVDTAGNRSSIEHTDHLFIGAISPGFEYHFAQSGPVSGYVGALLSYSSGVKTIGADTAQESSISSALMVGPILGAEFFAWDNFSFGAEYMLGFQSTSITSKVGDEESDGPSFTNIGTSSFAVRATLYFE